MAKHVKIPADILEKLKGASVVSDTVSLVIQVDGVPEKWLPVFHLRSMTYEERKKYADLVEKDPSKAIFEGLRMHVASWENLYDLSTGENFEYTSDEDGFCSVDALNLIPMNVKNQISVFLADLQLGKSEHIEKAKAEPEEE